MKLLYCILALLTLSVQKLALISLKQMGNLKDGELESGQLVEVTHSYTELGTEYNENALHRHYYVMRVMNRDKRMAYEQMKRAFGRVVAILKKYKVIPSEASLVKSKIKPQYLSKKRKWAFSTIFVIMGGEEELRKCQAQFIPLGIQKLNAKPSINFLNEKVRALQLFAEAKAKLQSELRRFSGFEIKEIEYIEIDGLHLANSDLIEKQIEEEFSDSEQNVAESEIEGEENGNSVCFEMKIVFKVGESGEEQSEVDFEEEEDREDSDDTEEDTEQESI